VSDGVAESVGGRADVAVRARVGGISGNPSPDEVAAIVAAVEVAWPRAAAPTEAPAEPSRWRFSGRWWSKPLPSRRDRP
jgi:hypothetical protein